MISDTGEQFLVIDEEYQSGLKTTQQPNSMPFFNPDLAADTPAKVSYILRFSILILCLRMFCKVDF
jgi:hypothetical protein